MSAKRTRAQPAGLSSEAIARAALALLDREGQTAVTMRRVAADLGIGTMTIYGYFRSKSELLDAAADRAAEEVSIPPRRGPWRRQLRELVAEMHVVLARHPRGVEMRTRRPILGRGALRCSNAALEILLAAGFDKLAAARAWRLLFTYTFGYSAFSPVDLGDTRRRELLVRFSSLPIEELPHIVESAAEAVEAMAGEATFYEGLEVILDGLEARLRSRRTTQATKPHRAKG